MGRKSTVLDIPCVICGEIMKLNNSQRKHGRKCCSKKCMGIFNTKPKLPNFKCQNCGILFYAKPCLIRKNKVKYCSKKCLNVKNTAPRPYRRKIRVACGDGHYKVCYPNHPRSTKDNYVMEHVLVAEKLLGRFLDDNECIHHVNGKKDDNRPENLYLFATESNHKSYHASIKWHKIEPIIKSNLI